MENYFLQLSTLVFAIFIGVTLFILSGYVRLPAIVLLLAGGIILGPEFLGLIHPGALKEGLRVIISLAVAVILFEGGLTLNPEGLKKAPKMIWRLLTLGVLVTWLGTATLLYFLLDFTVEMSLLAGSLIIVTGPTVIAPLLKRIRIKARLYHVLHWEGVLIDPIGVFIAILCFEWLAVEGSVLTHVWHLSLRLFIGLVLGYIGGKAITGLLRKEVIPEEQSNIFVFGAALFLFSISDFIVHESGILTVVIAGLVIGWAAPPRLKHIKQFKSELTELSIALVFMLLAANLKLESFLDIGWMGLLVLAGVLFLIRPLSVLLCSVGTSLSLNEKLFLSWIAPRGVVAGSMASLFGLRLAALGHPESVFLETFTFSIIISTILIQGGTAGMLARALKVEQPDKTNWLIVGAHEFSRRTADFISRNMGGECVLVDTNADAVNDARARGYSAYRGNALSTDVLPPDLFVTIGHVLALTDNRDLNQLICENWSEVVEKKNLYRWSSQSPEVEKKIAGPGIPVWPHMPKPSQVSYQLLNGDLALRQPVPGRENRGRVLLSLTSGGITFGESGEKDSVEAMLVMERLKTSLAGLLDERHVRRLEAKSYEEALSGLMDLARALYPDLPFDKISPRLFEREQEFPTTLAHGVAAPHIHCQDIDRAFCFVGIVPDGLTLRTYEGDSVRLLFLLLSPESDPELHLRLLAEIAKVASSAEKVEHMLGAADSRAFVERIKTNRA